MFVAFHFQTCKQGQSKDLPQVKSLLYHSLQEPQWGSLISQPRHWNTPDARGVIHIISLTEYRNSQKNARIKRRKCNRFLYVRLSTTPSKAFHNSQLQKGGYLPLYSSKSLAHAPWNPERQGRTPTPRFEIYRSHPASLNQRWLFKYWTVAQSTNLL